MAIKVVTSNWTSTKLQSHKYSSRALLTMYVLKFLMLRPIVVYTHLQCKQKCINGNSDYMLLKINSQTEKNRVMMPF